jgi:predicted ATP-dependent protease
MRLQYLILLCLVISLITNVFQYNENKKLSYEIKSLKANIQELKELYEHSLHDLRKTEEKLRKTEEALEETKSNLEKSTYALVELNSSLNDAEKTIEKLNFSRTVEAQILGVRTASNTGTVLPLRTELRNGEGRLLIDTTGILLEEDVQDTMKTALQVAQNFTGKDISDKDIVFHIVNPLEETISISGGSAGAIMTISIIAALEDRNLKEGIMITGKIRENGKIGNVIYIMKKAEAARDYGAKTLLVPKGQKAFVPGIEIVEVSNISEVAALMLE